MLKIIIIIALIVRLINLDQSFWLDEASQAQSSVLGLHEIWFERSGDFQPPLFYFLSHFWLIFGHSEVWARLLPISFGIVNIYAIYLLTRNLLNEKSALISSFILATNPFHIYYSQEFRMYSLLCLLATVSMYLFLKKSRWLFLVNSLLFYTHYSSIFLFVVQIVYVLLFDRQKLKFCTLHFALCTLLLVPWLPQFFSQLHSGINIDNYLPGWRSVLTLGPIRSLPLILFKLVAGRITLLPRSVYVIYVLFVLCVTVIGLALAYSHRKLLYIWAFLPIILSILLSFKIPQTQPFRLIFILPAVVILMSQTVTRFPKTFLTILVYISLVGNFLYFTRPRLQREQWRQAISFLSPQNTPVIVKFSAPFAPIYWYAPQMQTIAAISEFPAQPRQVETQLSPYFSNQRVFLLDYLGDLTDPTHLTELTIENIGFAKGQVLDFPGVGFVTEYRRL